MDKKASFERTLKKLKNDDILNLTLEAHVALVERAERLRKDSKLPKEHLENIIAELAKKQGMIRYKGIWCAPFNRIRVVIDKNWDYIESLM